MPAPAPTKVRLLRLSHMRYAHEDLAKTEAFLLDFGMTVNSRSADGNTVYFKGSGPDPYLYVATKADKSAYLGGVFQVASRAELEKASKEVPGAGPIEKLDGPGGGEIVRVVDPDGLPFSLVFGIEPVHEEEQRPEPRSNFPKRKARSGEYCPRLHPVVSP
jgi:catechol 2,3-dioxygenase-like lactoylglutathione lyase family enzyme